MKRLATFCSAVAFGLVACGNQPPNTMSPAARERLISGVQQVRVAASGQDRPAAETALTALIRDIASAQARGELDAESARTMLRAADRVSEDVRAMDGPPAPPPVVVRVPVRIPQPRPPQEPPGNPGGERSAVVPQAPPAQPVAPPAPPAPPAAPPAQQVPGTGQQPARDVPPPQSGNSGRAPQSDQSQNGQGEDGQGEDG